MKTSLEDITRIVNDFKEYTPLKDKLSDKEKHKIRKIYKNNLLNVFTETDVIVTIEIEKILTSIFGYKMFKDINELNELGKLYKNTKI